MLSVQLRDSIECFLSQHEAHLPFTSAVGKLASYFNDSKQYIAAQAEGGDKLNSAASNLHSRFANLRAVTKDIVPQHFYTGLSALRDSLDSELPPALHEHAFIRTLRVQIDAFVNLYDSYLMEQNGLTAAPLLLAANDLNRQIIATSSALGMISATLETSSETEESSSVFSLVLESEQSLEEFGNKLLALASLYAELCQVLGIAPQSRPLRIRKVESGSFWLKGDGDPAVVALMASVISALAGFLYRRYTTEGKLSAVPRNLEGLNAAVDIVGKLKSMGVDTSESDESLKKAAAAAARDLAVLLDGESSIRVNGNPVRLADHARQQLLSESKLKRLAGPERRIEPQLNDSDPPTDAAA